MCFQLEIGTSPARSIELTRLNGRDGIQKSTAPLTVGYNAYRGAFVSGASGLLPSNTPSGTILGPVEFSISARLTRFQYLDLLAIMQESQRLFDIQQDGSIKLSDRYDEVVDNGLGATVATQQRAFATGVTAATVLSNGVDIAYYASYNVVVTAFDHTKQNAAGEQLITIGLAETSIRKP